MALFMGIRAEPKFESPLCFPLTSVHNVVLVEVIEGFQHAAQNADSIGLSVAAFSWENLYTALPFESGTR